MPELTRPGWIRNRVHQLVVVIAGVTLLVIGGGLAVGGDGNEDKTVPWVDQPAARPSVSVGTKPEPRPVLASCQPKDLESLWPEGGSTFVDSAGGSDATGFAVLVRNVGAAPCTLTGHPEVQGIDREGKPIGAPAQEGSHLPNFGHGRAVATIEPGEPARVFLSMASAGCAGPEMVYSGAELLWGNRFHLRIKNAWLKGTCPLKVSAWEPAASDTGRFWALETRLQTPPSAEAGTEMSYVLELINITSATVNLDPCPVFTHAIAPESTFDIDEIDSMVHSTHRLNCSSGSVGPRAIVRYQMKISIPKGFPVGETIVHWMVEGSPRPHASAMFLVTG